MKIEKINRFELKALKDSPIYEERSPAMIPFVVVNENKEILFGNNSLDTCDEYGNVECIIIEGLDNMKSRQMAFALHYLGLSCVIGYKNFNSMDCPIPSLKNLYLWNTSQFEEAAYRENVAKGISNKYDLF